MLKKILGSAVTAMLVSAPIAASAAAPVRPAASLVSASTSVAQTGVRSGIRQGVAKKGGSAADGDNTGAYVLGAIGLGLAIWGIIEITSDDDKDVSPD